MRVEHVRAPVRPRAQHQRTLDMVALYPGKRMAPITVSPKSFTFPVMLVASGELYVVHKIEEYVMRGPMDAQMKKLIQNPGSRA